MPTEAASLSVVDGYARSLNTEMSNRTFVKFSEEVLAGTGKMLFTVVVAPLVCGGDLKAIRERLDGNRRVLWNDARKEVRFEWKSVANLLACSWRAPQQHRKIHVEGGGYKGGNTT
jgi:hypothetical protein